MECQLGMDNQVRALLFTLVSLTHCMTSINAFYIRGSTTSAPFRSLHLTEQLLQEERLGERISFGFQHQGCLEDVFESRTTV